VSRMALERPEARLEFVSELPTTETVHRTDSQPASTGGDMPAGSGPTMPLQAVRPRRTGSWARHDRTLDSQPTTAKTSRSWQEPGGLSRVEARRGPRACPGRSKCSSNSPAVTVLGPKSASARPGPCTRPRSADALTRREYHPARQPPASRSFVLGRPVVGGLRRLRGALAACGG
jgi:hypothetical protein